MARTATEKVRLTPHEKHRLELLARGAGKTKSEVLREGLRLVERVRRRRMNVNMLVDATISMGEGEPRIRLKR